MTHNIAQTILSSLLTSPHQIAIEGESDSLSRRQLFDTVESRVIQLKQTGVASGDFVVTLCDRGMSFWVDLLALWIIGALPICLESSIDEAAGQNVKDLTDAKFISSGTEGKPDVFSDLKLIPPVNFEAVAVSAGSLSMRRFEFSHNPSFDMAGLIFTSGTTGLPKGVPLTHTALYQNALGTASRLGLRPNDKLMIATPFRFISSISHFIVTLISGATFCGTEQKLMAADLIDRLATRNITSFGGSPFHASMIAKTNQKALPALKWLMSSGDHLPVKVIEELFENFPGIRINTVYGMAEMGGRICCLPPEYLESHKGSVGYPISGLEIVVLDDDDQECGAGEVGKIFTRGAISFPGYFKNDAANENVITSNGFRTGDVGYLNDNGLLYLSGRSDSVFKRSGLKVSSQVITDAILALNIFDDAIVMSSVDAVEGHVPVAYAASQDTSLTKGGLLRLLRPHLANNHLPKSLVYLPQIPRTGSGKVDRRKLKALLADLD